MTHAGEIAAGRAGHGLGIVVGSAAAARCFARLPEGVAPLIVTSHGDPDRARTGARQLAARGARAIISFGPAVGLAPVLRPGDLVIAECVVLPSGETLATDLAWRTQLVRCLSPLNPSLKVARLAGRGRQPVAAGKARHFEVRIERAQAAYQPGAPGGVGRDPRARRQHDALGDHQVARTQHRRQAHRRAEADERTGAPGGELLRAGPGAARIAVAGDGQQRDALGQARKASARGRAADDDAEPHGGRSRCDLTGLRHPRTSAARLMPAFFYHKLPN